ncbi:putative transposase [Caldisericum exile AZM16c01]|uniref:Transposase n=1 Tax=Caldisericum exile (strain DSM 21853 / NBRC 104410 / AZM16c01) TaxID=511051 RepID=A0A7U6GDD6_CALEA|nr:putative transposase [Caldisericum exile AZM16c01]
MFNEIIEQCKRKNLLSERLKIADATAIEGDVSVPNRVNLLRQGRKIVIKRISKVERNACDNFRDYINEERLHGKPSPQEVKEEISKTKEFIKSIKGQYGEDVEDLINILKELCEHKGNNNDEDDSGRRDENSDKDCQSQSSSQEKHIVSFADTDVRFGAKSDKKKFVGYKAHIAMDESGIVTSVNLLHGNESESTDLPALLRKDESIGIEGYALTADSLYDSAKNREFIHRLGLKAYIPPRRKERDEEGFIYDPKEDIITCPPDFIS